VTFLLPAIVLGVLVLGETIILTVLSSTALVLTGVALIRHRTVGDGEK
jgi:drug/metabolite transporter (DMT)-like permease